MTPVNDDLYATISIDEVRAENEKRMTDDYFESPGIAEQGLIGKVVSFFAFDQRVQFFSEFMSILRCTPSEAIETAGVHVKNGNFYMRYNPAFLMALPPSELRFLFMHEILHIALGHCTTRSSNDKLLHEKENAMMDLAINSALKRLCEDRDKGYEVTKLVEILHHNLALSKALGYPDEVAILKQGKPCGLYPQEEYSPPYALFKDMKDGDAKFKSFEWYWNNCPESPEGYGGGACTHGGWSDEESAAEKVRVTIDKIESKGAWGLIGADLQDAIRAAQSAKVPWSRMFKLALGNWGKFFSTESRTRPHRVLGYDAPGSKSSGRDSILFCRDTSASVGDADQEIILSELNSFQKKFGRVFLTDFDTQIHDDPPRTWDRKLREDTITGRGGTNFHAVTERLSQRGKGWVFKHVVMLTDGECDYPELPTGVNFLWVITKGGQRPPYSESNRCKIIMM